MFPGGIFLDDCDKRIASFSQFSFLSQLGRRLKFWKTNVRQRCWRNFPALLFFYCDFFFYKGVVTKPGSAAKDDQRKQQDEKPLHGRYNVVATSSEIRESRRTRKHQGDPGSITRRIVCEESIAATEIGFAYEAPVPDSLPGKKRCQSRPIVGSSRLFQVKWQSWQ